ncbi:hypothetical protein CIHG_08157 [Coccidioides immitis H538.4]|uniref:Uncharacterized protein n=1 Tax=Coccidioides immitis H538.4 TaxID=396776 RepID=A0A0J8URS6_COCIT|nr:hypothetical protein CIHG_08157 [Coccidioides immitis H538.4]
MTQSAGSARARMWVRALRAWRLSSDRAVSLRGAKSCAERGSGYHRSGRRVFAGTLRGLPRNSFNIGRWQCALLLSAAARTPPACLRSERRLAGGRGLGGAAGGSGQSQCLEQDYPAVACGGPRCKTGVV